ncbi:GNAT family N-acetyltransferase [Bacillus suaedaesalsae]|uniref:GNAT family N-acetyltransferase n=1 Tax=Bacillus suaedaesalsae TaxID=2810349 RepID=A0ABS2DK79_9BACI|nr:GNAT family N-acetyltransferase [Bacillus suaedaesalsae]MBM6618906.1 GNAT family N-acetyltransferase [Bacillus suaedaesalsae]
MFDRKIILENERVMIVPFSLEYKDELKEIIFDSSIWTYMGLTIQTDEDFDTYITSTLQEKHNQKSYPFIIIDKMTNKVAGSTRFGNIHLFNKRLEIGWTWYGSEYQGTGLNHACKYELLKFAFEELGFNRVQFSADIENHRSQKAILKLGAKQEGIFRSNYIDENGNARDDVYFSIVANEWEKVKKQSFKFRESTKI